MRTVGLFINDGGFNNKKLNYLEEGNPGIGGTQFEFALLAYYLSLDKKNKVIVYHCNINTYPEMCEDILVSDFEECIKTVGESNIDVFICQANLPHTIKYLKQYKVNAILWAHNFLRPNRIFRLASCEFVKKIVCVGRKEYYITRMVTNKAVLIYNMVSPLLFEPNADRKKVITYIGSLIPPKGFHILAKEWPMILRKVPDAELYVVGSGQLYNENVKLGPYGIAEAEYEALILKLMELKNPTESENVHFLGNLGLEKKEIIMKTLVGVVNPSGKSETFGISALDFNVGGYSYRKYAHNKKWSKWL